MRTCEVGYENWNPNWNRRAHRHVYLCCYCRCPSPNKESDAGGSSPDVDLVGRAVDDVLADDFREQSELLIFPRAGGVTVP